MRKYITNLKSPYKYIMLKACFKWRWTAEKWNGRLETESRFHTIMWTCAGCLLLLSFILFYLYSKILCTLRVPGTVLSLYQPFLSSWWPYKVSTVIIMPFIWLKEVNNLPQNTSRPSDFMICALGHPITCATSHGLCED